MGRRIFRRPYMFMRHRARRMEHRIARAVGAGSVAGAVAGTVAGTAMNDGSGKSARAGMGRKERRENTSFGSRAGSAVGAVLDTKNKVKDKATACQGEYQGYADPDRLCRTLRKGKGKSKCVRLQAWHCAGTGN